NDVKALTREVDLFGDLAAGRSYDTVDRLAGLYAGNFDKALRRARDDLAESTLRATGPWGEGDQTDVVKVAADALAGEFAAYVYDLVDARTALAELGAAIPVGQAVRALQLALPPDVRGHGWFAAAAFVPE